MKASLSSPSAVFFELVAFPERVFFCLFQTALIPFERRKAFKRNGGELAKEKEALDVIPNKFEFHSREAWREFKLDEDT